MDPSRLRELFDLVGRGEVTSEQAIKSLSVLSYEDLGIARVDHHRHLRVGIPEVIFGEGKTAEQIVLIAKRLLEHHGRVLATRVEPSKAEHVLASMPMLSYDKTSRIVSGASRPAASRRCSPVAVVAAGTSDLPVAEEAAQTLEFEGVSCVRIYDAGVAGIHRLFGSLSQISGASAVVVVAGMEGALPSVVGGLVPQPIVAVPTSIGYGAALSGLTALFSMLTSCASGISVVNIDNGFGAAMAVLRIVGREQGETGCNGAVSLEERGVR